MQGVEVWNKWREEYNRRLEASRRPPFLDRIDLSRADLGGAKLRNTDLTWVDLSGANLNQADLRDVNLMGVLLDNANLSGADISGVYFHSASLAGANLSHAFLVEASFSKVDLSRTNFTDARLGFALFGDVDLSSTVGLDSIEHIGPSTIGIDTLYRSQGKIPEVFLRGAGVSQDLIDYLPSLLNQPIQFYSAFISYSHKDKPFARRLHDALQGRGIRCWLDEHQLLPGDDIYEQIDRGVRLWDKVLLCCSESSLTSWWVDTEIERAFKKEQELFRERGKKVLALIPLNLDDYVFSDVWRRTGKATTIGSRKIEDFTGWEQDNAKFEEQLERVIKALMADDKGRDKPPKPML